MPTPSTPYRRQRPVQQTSAEFTEEMLTPSGHYKVEFTGSVCGPLRVITVRMPVLDLALYGPVIGKFLVEDTVGVGSPT